MYMDKSTQNPFLSICITSYNRIFELDRCLRSIDVVQKGLIEIVVSEDCSPRENEISAVVDCYASETKHSVRYNTNEHNLGYDCNLGKLVQLAKGEYVLFMSDDDAFLPQALDRTIDELRNVDCGVAFSPFIFKDIKLINRKHERTMIIPKGIESVKKFLYNSILFSGLIFKRRTIMDYPADNFKNLIYYQVYLFASTLYSSDGYYINVPLVNCINDGENAFGLSESSEKSSLLADRKSIYSNLEYHKGLIRVIEIFDEENKTDLKRSFIKEYSLRSYGGMSNACREGRESLVGYWSKMRALNIKLPLIAKIYYVALKVFGYKICDLLFNIPKKLLLYLRRNGG